MAEVLLRVHNNVLMDAITIHVHGIDKHDAKSTVMLSRVVVYGWCSVYSTVPYSKHKLYRFIADNKGTHWYHGHFQTDRGDGLLGGR
ncbi:unnamed protein product [Strongylus vulgaris]|uniref:Plastocyanin-like domain-containing protein n=1 Tax=Strongylus vulgaris TaxID=40348 RepID=A0A3P7IYD6_STRVU|nr:unnamed protein product [Strongylus vulgaris]